MWSWLIVLFMIYRVSLFLGTYILLIVLSFSDKRYHLKKERNQRYTMWTPEWEQSSLSHPIRFHVVTGVWGALRTASFWWDLGGYFSLQNRVCELTLLENMERKMSTCHISPLHSICIYVCAYARPPSSRKNWMHPWHFSICTKQFVPSSFHNLQIFTSIPNPGKCNNNI